MLLLANIINDKMKIIDDMIPVNRCSAVPNIKRKLAICMNSSSFTLMFFVFKGQYFQYMSFSESGIFLFMTSVALSIILLFLIRVTSPITSSLFSLS